MRPRLGMRASGLLIVMVVTARVSAADFAFTPPRSVADSGTEATMRDLAERLLPVYQEPDPDRYLATLSALQMVAGSYAAADVSRHSLLARNPKPDSRRPIGRGLIFDIYAEAKARAVQDRIAFSDSFAKTFRRSIPMLTDLQSYQLSAWLSAPPADFRQAVQNDFDRLRQHKATAISETDATRLIWSYLSFDAYREFAPLVAGLEADDRGRRYVEAEIVVQTPNGGHVSARVVRPITADRALPALFEFTHDLDSSVSTGLRVDFAQESAAHGYVGVLAHARASADLPAAAAQFELDGEDARAVLDWIAIQPWSDGRIGMYGEGISGFVAWSVAQRNPPALKAFATSGASAPGIDFPMEGNIPLNSGFSWVAPTPSAKGLKKAIRGNVLDERWYRSGRRYRDLGRVAGSPSRSFVRWLNHPSYDRYWQKLIPYRQQFASIAIPVLTLAGFYAASEPAAIYYFRQHSRYAPRVDHTLLIGPYDDATLRENPSAQLRRLRLDPSAVVDLHALRYEWFDHIFKDGSLPTLLQDRINYQVAGTDEWRHSATLATMESGRMRVYLGSSALRVGSHGLLETASDKNFTAQTVNFTDRRDADWTATDDLVTARPEIRNSIVFEGAPLKHSIDLSGALSGHLDITVNKMDVDLAITLWECSDAGIYTQLLSPAYQFRASYARDRAHRHLLKAGERQGLDFQSERLVGRRLQAGSRLVVIVSVQKRPDQEINYGTGGDVSEESVADGKIPLKLRWHAASYMDIPIRR